MTTHLRTRSQSSRVFLLSGIPDGERKVLAKSITSLGGIYFDTESYRSNCTHVVCGKLTRSEKFLGACSTGKWVLHPKYIQDSAIKGEWLDENLYDWCHMNFDADLNTKQMREAPRRWRHYVEAFGTNAFTGWKTAVVVNGTKKTSVYKRLLHSGGADVFNLKLPVTKPERIVNTLAYIFVSDKFAAQVCHLMEYGVLCLRPEYIGDFLIKDPTPDPLDYLVKVSDTMLHNLSTDINLSISCSQDDITCSQSISTNSCTSELLPLSGISSTNNSCKSNVGRVLTRSNKITKSRSSSRTNSRSASPCRSVSDIRVSAPSKTSSTQSLATPSSNETSSTAKRKLCDTDVECALKELKKQKALNGRHIWKPTVLVLSRDMDAVQTNGHGVPMEFSDSMTGIIHSCVEEDSSTTDFMTYALDLVTSILNNKRFPKASTLNFILTKILQDAKKPVLANKAHGVLMRLLLVHPPVTPTLVKLYLSSLMDRRSPDASDDKPFGHEWEFIKSVIQNVLQEPDEGYSSRGFERVYHNNILLLKFLVGSIEENFKSCLQITSKGNPHKLGSSLLAQILWQSIYQVSLNTRCMSLISLLGDCVCSMLDDFKKVQVLSLLLPLVSMCVECCNLIETPQAGSVQIGQKTTSMIHEIARKIDVGHLENHMLRYILQSLQPSWLCLHVCCQLLNTMDDYLILEGAPKEENISLKAIVSRYFFMLPKLQTFKRKIIPGSPTPKKKLRSESVKDDAEKHVEMVQEIKENVCNKSLAKRACKKNVKGETPLHVACIKNDVMKVKQLLQVPGIDVNAKDNVGWTPLHEACNHGNLQCVRELLNFIPAKTVEHYFSKDGQKCRKVDLLQTSDEGITPLHDAVLNNRLDVCQLLLKHGGSKLLYCRTLNNYTPMDLAMTEEMKTLLLSHQNDHLPNSQGSESSQEANPPSKYLYEQVLGKSHQERFSDQDDCLKYISIITSTVHAYLDVIHIHSVQKALIQNVSQSCQQDGINEHCDNRVPSCGIETKESAEEDVVFMSSQGLKEATQSPDTDFNQVTQLKSDLKVVRKLSKHVNRFQDHVLRISYPDDHPTIQNQLIGLKCLADSTCVSILI